MTNEQKKQLCLRLMNSNTEKEIIQILKDRSLWDDPKIWRWLGDEEFNYSSVGNQQSRPEQAIVEKLVNSIDAKLICEARKEGHLPPEGSEPQLEDTPKSLEEARNKYFKEGKVVNSNSITVSTTANGIPSKGFNNPCFSIADDGEGQTPRKMPETILSLHRGNKDKIQFVQGKFNMGGTGVLEFCGKERNVQFILSRRHPKLLTRSTNHPSDNDWSFTIIRRENPSNGKSSRFAYLAPVDSNFKPRCGGLLHFFSDTMPIFPVDSKPYVRESRWGTLVKLFEYDARRIKGHIMLQGGLVRQLRLMLPNPALPINFHECRPFGSKKGSSHTQMQGFITALKNDYRKQSTGNVVWYNMFQFVIDCETFTAELFLFKDQNAAKSYKTNEGLLFTYNGQCHATISKDFFRRKRVKLDYVWNSLLMFVDCSLVSRRAHEKLFMNSRDRLRDGYLKTNLEEEIINQLTEHPELKRLVSERRRKELTENEVASESMAKIIEEFLSKNPMLAFILDPGTRIKNPHKPVRIGVGEAGFDGKRFPTRFHFKGKSPINPYIRDANIGSRIRLTLETDAENDYFERDEEPGKLTFYNVKDNCLSELANYPKTPSLVNGIANLSLNLPNSAKEGDILEFEIQVNDPSRVEPFKCLLQINVRPATIHRPGTATSGTGSGSSSGQGKGSKGFGNQQSVDGKLDIPKPQSVYEKDWKNHDPEFDRFTAVRIKNQPDVPDDKTRYDFFINMDNIHLQTYMKSKPKEANNLKLKFSVGMILLSLSILHQDKITTKEEDNENNTLPKGDVRDQIATTTSAIAPTLLPMIESVSELDDKDNYLSDVAGETI